MYKIKLILGIIAAVYVFILLPAGVVYLVANDKLDLGFASNLLNYIGTLTTSPAGSFVWSTS